MKMMKLTAMFVALLAILTLTACGNDDKPSTVTNTKWEKEMNTEELKQFALLMSQGEDMEDFVIPDGTTATFSFDFFSGTDVYFDLNLVTPLLPVKMRMQMPYTYNASTETVLFKLSKSTIVSVEPQLPAFSEIDFSEADDAVGKVNWDQKTLTINFTEDGATITSLILKQTK